MRLAVTTWNVNSVRKRLDGLARLIEAERPDLLCLQETKVIDADFPAAALAALGYPHQVIHGQKGYNGVAVLSRLPLEPIEGERWCGLEDRRHVAARVRPERGPALEVHSLYVPAGGDRPNPEVNPRFAHKLKFLKELARWSQVKREEGTPVLLAGDLNVAPLVSDVWSHERLKTVVTHTRVERDLLLAAQAAGGWIDALRETVPEDQHIYTWWSYRTPDWGTADKGRRLDHVWLSPDLKGSLREVTVLREARGWAPPSDHVPVTVRLDLG